MQDLAQALKHPTMVMTAGTRDQRNSLKKANGMVRFGAGLMLGAALLSPLNALATNENTQQLWQQTTEVRDEARPGSENPARQVLTVEQLEQMQKDGIKPDWFNIEVEGRTWNRGGPAGEAYDIPTWIQFGHQGPTLTQTGNDVVIGDGYTQEPTPQTRPDYKAQFQAERDKMDIEARRDAPKFKFGRNPYNLDKKVALGDTKLKNATPEQMEAFVSRLAQDAYIELQAGHTIQSPSQRLVDICQHIEDVAAVSKTEIPDVPHAQQAFEACQSDQMQSSMLANTAKKAAMGVGGIAAAILFKAGAVLAFAYGGGGLINAGMSMLRRKEEENPIEAAPRVRTVMDPKQFEGPVNDQAQQPAQTPRLG